MLPPRTLDSVEGLSSATSERKLRRVTELDNYAASSASSEFSSRTKRDVDRLNPEKSCFHCGATPTDGCHVIGKKDRTFPELVQEGLISFKSLGDIDNAISYCPLCHRNFDDLQKPGLILWPVDISYFAQFERNNFADREAKARATGVIPPRLCPNAQMYHEHQIKDKQVDRGASGGLYVRYTLENYLPQMGQDTNWIPGVGPFSEPKSWHGDPMATLHRCFHILGSPRPLLPMEVKRQLDELRDLYQRKITMVENLAETSHHNHGENDNNPDDHDDQRDGDGRRGGGGGGSDPRRASDDAYGFSPVLKDTRGSQDQHHGGGHAGTDEGSRRQSKGSSYVVDSGTFLMSARSPMPDPDEEKMAGRNRKERNKGEDDELPRKRVRRQLAGCMAGDVWQWGPLSNSNEKIKVCTQGPR